jgi:radical SAM superfamily enzyme YgiQ (UPF0313 family)
LRLLLINPAQPESFWSFRWALERVLDGKRALNPPLGLATLAALCPPHWQVTIVDENVEPLPLQPQADLIGIGGMGVQSPRGKQLLRYYREAGYKVVAGGSYASLCPEEYLDLADSVIAGEAEYTWPRFCADFESGSFEKLYRETGNVELEDSPTPRFDLLKLERYATATIQLSRGCPFRCDFCDIIVMFGRQPRTKSTEQIGRELDRLRACNVRSVFFVDDNLIGNKKLAKQLLRYLENYQQRHGYAFRFGTEASVNLAEDEELLRLFRAANFHWVFIGIESPDEASLRETNKTQNLKHDLLGAIHKIYRYGIDVLAGFIVGFDNDTLETFEKQRRFITRSGIQVAMVGLLTALPRTPLYERLQREGRLIEETEHGDNTKLGTNFLPKRMHYDDMVRHYRSLYQRLFSDGGIAQRIRNKVRHFRPHSAEEYSLPERLRILRRLVRAVCAGGPTRIYYFFSTLALARPRIWPQILLDWTAGISMHDYIRRHFVRDAALGRRIADRTVAALKRLCMVELRLRTMKIDVLRGGRQFNVCISLRGEVSRASYRRAGRRLEKLLRRSAATLTLSIEALRADRRRYVERLLARIAPYGDRVSIWIDASVRPHITIDSSVFHMLLSPTRPADPA